MLSAKGHENIALICSISLSTLKSNLEHSTYILQWFFIANNLFCAQDPIVQNLSGDLRHRQQNSLKCLSTNFKRENCACFASILIWYIVQSLASSFAELEAQFSVDTTGLATHSFRSTANFLVNKCVTEKVFPRLEHVGFRDVSLRFLPDPFFEYH